MTKGRPPHHPRSDTGRLPARRAASGGRCRMPHLLLCAALLAAPAMSPASTLPSKTLPAIIAQIDAGHFQAADAAIAKASGTPGLDAGERDALAFQRERMRRMRLDFSLDAAQVQARVRKQIPDLTQAEFDRWNRQGLFEHLTIDGRTWYFNRSPGNLFRLSAEARARRAVQAPFDDGPNEVLNDHHRTVLREALASGRSGVDPHRVEVTQTLTVEADAVPAGQTLRAWIPYPRAIPGQQEGIRLVGSVPAGARVAPESAPQRTAYLEKKAVAGRPTVFSVTYDVTVLAQYHRIDADKVAAETITPALAPFVAERPPHIVFTDDLRAFSRKVVGD